MNLTELEILVDLELLENEPLFVPEEEPQARALFPDALDPDIPVGYSSLHPGVQIVSVERKNHPTSRAAWEWFNTFTSLRNLRSIDGEIYWTKRCWFFRVVPQAPRGDSTP